MQGIVLFADGCAPRWRYALFLRSQQTFRVQIEISKLYCFWLVLRCFAGKHAGKHMGKHRGSREHQHTNQYTAPIRAHTERNLSTPTVHFFGTDDLNSVGKLKSVEGDEIVLFGGALPRLDGFGGVGRDEDENHRGIFHGGVNLLEKSVGVGEGRFDEDIVVELGLDVVAGLGVGGVFGLDGRVIVEATGEELSLDIIKTQETVFVVACSCQFGQRVDEDAVGVHEVHDAQSRVVGDDAEELVDGAGVVDLVGIVCLHV